MCDFQSLSEALQRLCLVEFKREGAFPTPDMAYGHSLCLRPWRELFFRCLYWVVLTGGRRGNPQRHFSPLWPSTVSSTSPLLAFSLIAPPDPSHPHRVLQTAEPLLGLSQQWDDSHIWYWLLHLTFDCCIVPRENAVGGVSALLDCRLLLIPSQ